MAPFNGNTFSRALVFLLFLSVLFSAISAVSLKYSRAELLLLRPSIDEAISTPELSDLEEFGKATGVNQLVQRSAQPKHVKRNGRKRRRRGGLLVRLRHRNCKTPGPSMILSNVQRLHNKMDELMCRIGNQRDYKECCVFCF